MNSTAEVNFILVINPSSGPGNASDLESDYFPALRPFSQCTNVQTVGYVRTGYGMRDLDDILADVQTYAAWSSIDSRLAVHGIFFDESAYEDGPGIAQTLYAMNLAAKAANGILGARTVGDR